MNVLLVANYETDRQESMLRFAATLHAGLQAQGVNARIIRPVPLIGRLKRSGAGIGKWLGYFDKFVLFPPELRRAAEAADVVHICDHSNAMYLPHAATQPHLITCHDLLALRSALGEFPEHRTGWSGRVLQRWISKSLRRARHIACVSEATRKDVLRLAGVPSERVTVIHNGLNHPYAPVPEIAAAAEARRCGEPFDPAVFARHGLPTVPYLLHVGGTQWYKNRAGVVAAHAALGAAAPLLVVAGRRGGGLPAHVEHRSDVSSAELAALYSGAELLLFPSVAEGFGWPIVEAQACGCRVVTTGLPPMSEVGGDAAIYVADPTDSALIADTVRSVLAQDAATRRNLIAAGLANAARFSTARMVNEYLTTYSKLIAA